MTPEYPPRIPTIRKAHLPPGFAYPLGAGPVSEVLAEVPQFAKLTLSFSNLTPLLRPPLRVPGLHMKRMWAAIGLVVVVGPTLVHLGDQIRRHIISSR